MPGGRPTRILRRRQAGSRLETQERHEEEAAEERDLDEDDEADDEDSEEESAEASTATDSDEHDVSWSYFAGGIAPALLTREEEVLIGRRLVRARAVLVELKESAPEPLRKRIAKEDEGLGFRERDILRMLERTERLAAHPERFEPELATQIVDFRDRLRDAVAAYRSDRDRLLEANLRLVLSLGRRYRRNGVPFLDLVQEGTLGLIRAVEKYDPDRDVRFGTYAVWWIWQQIGRAGDLHSGLIRTPLHWNQIRRKVGRATQQLQTDGASVERADIAAASGVDADRLDVVHQNFQCLSLESPIGGNDDRPLEELLASDSPDPENDVTATDLNQHIESALHELARKYPREADVLRLRFGTGNQDTLTLEDIGKMFNVSRERVRQIEARALKLLLPICEKQGLRVFFD